MNAYEVARQAIAATNYLNGILNPLQLEKLAKAHIAQWLYDQDESISSDKLREVFNEAMGIVTRHF